MPYPLDQPTPTLPPSVNLDTCYLRIPCRGGRTKLEVRSVSETSGQRKLRTPGLTLFHTSRAPRVVVSCAHDPPRTTTTFGLQRRPV
jgi:hypothetical protein